MSVSTSRGSSGATARTTPERVLSPCAASTPARRWVSYARSATRSPACRASAVSSSAASIDASKRGAPSTRAADVRPVSRTSSSCRSRSGRQVRTTTSARRALARQSIDRVSSPTTYSRRESNSVPCPRTGATTAPSSWRSRASFSGRNRRLVNGGRTITAQSARRLRCRAATPRGPVSRNVTFADRRSPRRDGSSVVVSRTPAPEARSSRCDRGVAPALGGQASRTQPRILRRPALDSRNVTRAGSSSRVLVAPSRASAAARGEAASDTSTSTHNATAAAAYPTIAPSSGTSRTTTTPASASRAARSVSATGSSPSAVPECPRGRRRAHRRG